MEELRANRFLESRELRTHGRLLNAVGDEAQPRSDSARFGHVIEKLEMVNVEHPAKVRRRIQKINLRVGIIN